MAPLTAVAVQRWPQYRRLASCCGLALMVSGLVAASFCNSVNGLIATQGVMYAVGGLVAYFPAMSLITEWFVQRRGLVFGIMWAGTGISGTVLPFLLQWMLNSYGYRTTLRAWAITLAILASCCIYFIKPRLPVTSASSFRPIDISFVKHIQFWVFQTGNILQSLGFFLPTLYIPSFALASNAVHLRNAVRVLRRCVLVHVVWVCQRDAAQREERECRREYGCCAACCGQRHWGCNFRAVEREVVDA